MTPGRVRRRAASDWPDATDFNAVNQPVPRDPYPYDGYDNTDLDVVTGSGASYSAVNPILGH